MTVALIVAAGSGERLGAGRPKAFVSLAGRPLAQWSIDALGEVEDVKEIVLSAPPGTAAWSGVRTVEGGPWRSDSVRRALAVAAEDDEVLVHDAARPLLTPVLAERVIAALRHDRDAAGAIAAARVTDTVKRADHGGAVVETLDRDGLWAVQTPQVFRRGALERALRVSDELLAAATDDAWLIERAGGRVVVVESGQANWKVTTPLDLQIAEMLLRGHALDR